MPATTSTPGAVPLHVDSDGRIATDLACLNCRYNLRSIPLTQSCPECGTPIRVTLRKDSLLTAPAPWRRSLHRGSTLLLVGTLLTPVLLYFGLLIATTGLFLLTRPEPGRAEPLGDTRLRWATRLLVALGTLLLVGLSLAVLGFVVAAGGRIWSIPSTVGGSLATWQYVDSLYIAGHGLFVLGFLAATFHLEALAQRIPDEPLRQRVRRARQGWLIATGAMIGIGLVASLANAAYNFLNLYHPWTIGFFAAAVFLVLLGLWAITLRLALSLRQHLARVAAGPTE